MTLREAPTVTPADVERLWALATADCRWADEVRVARSGRYFDVTGPAPFDAEAIVLETEAHEFRDALARNDIEPVRASVVEYAGRLGLAIRPDSINERILGRAVLQVFAEESERAAAKVRAEVLPFTAPPSQDPDLDDLWTEEVDADASVGTRPAAPTAEAPLHSSKAPSQFAGLTIEQLWPSFTGDQVSSRAWKQAIADQSFGTMRAWVKGIGPSLPGAITSAPAAEFRRIMRRLPSNYAKCAAWRDLGFAEITAAVEGSSYKPLAITTWNRHVSVMSNFWEWLLRNEQVGAGKNPFDGLWIDADEDLSVLEGGSEDRAMWSDDQLRLLLASPLFAGCQSPHRRHKPGTLFIRDAL